MKESINKFFEKHTDRDLILVNHSINRVLYQKLSENLKESKNKKCSLFLTTLGGDPDAAYRIGRALRHHYEEVRLVVPSYCKSAGTLITICANELAIGDLGELGPLDIQVPNSNELNEMNSGLDYIQAIQASFKHTALVFMQSLMEFKRHTSISTKLAGEFASQLAKSVAEPLYSQIDPMKLGDMNRKMDIAMAYGNRLASYTQNLKPGAMERLSGDYPSHSFVIDRKEAKELFERVFPMNSEELDIVEELHNHLIGPSQIEPLLLTGAIQDEQNENETKTE